jgi:hypothetical protein
MHLHYLYQTYQKEGHLNFYPQGECTVPENNPPPSLMLFVVKL